MIAGDTTLDCGPIRKIDAPSSRIEAIRISSHAAASPGRSSGREIVRIWCAHEAPQTRAHSSRLRSTCMITPAMVRSPKGRNTVKYAIPSSQSVP